MRWMRTLLANGTTAQAALLVALFAAGLALGLTVQTAEAAENSRVYVPKPPKGKGDKCMEDTKFMRANHMNLLKHQRDETMHNGIRTKKHSLKECVACHTVPGNDGRAVSYEDPKNFCRQCHDYAAVKLDCFECHASKPPKGQAKIHPNAKNAYRVSGGLPQ